MTLEEYTAKFNRLTPEHQKKFLEYIELLLKEQEQRKESETP